MTDKYFFRAVFDALSKNVIVSFIQLLIVVIIARYFGAETNGYFNVTLIVPMLLAVVLGLGLPIANAYYVGSGHLSVKKALAVCIKNSIVIFFVGCLLMLTSLYFKDAIYKNVNLSSLLLAFLSFPLIVFQNSLAGILQGKEDFIKLNLLKLVQPVVFLVTIVFCYWWSKHEVDWLLGAFLSSYFVSAVAYYVSIVDVKSETDKLVLRKSEKELLSTTPQEYYKYAYKSHLTNIVTFVNYRIDIFLVNYFVGPFYAGVYVVAVQLCEKLWMISGAISTILFPKLSKLSNTDKNKAKFTKRLFSISLVSTSAAALVLVLIAPVIVPFVFGLDFQPAIKAIYFLIPGVIATAGSRILANDVAARGRPELNLYGSVAVLVVNIVLNILLIPQYGIYGAALSTSLAYGVNFCIRLIVFLKVSSSYSET